MTTPVALPAQRAEPVAEPAPASRSENATPQPRAPKGNSPEAPERQPSTRLLIEDVGGSFVYTVLDRLSGQVIARIPREDVEHLGEVDGYEAGAMVNTEA